MTALSYLERRILDLIQQDFPLEADPYAVIGARVEATREETHAAVCRLKADGVIRRVGGSYVPRKMGYRSVLAAARVCPEALAATAAVLADIPEVTHNYEREDAYNLWFTVIAESDARLEAILDLVRGAEGVEAVYALPATRTFKLKVDFRFNREDADAD
jgi:DNA-binding Lrp family transcriptional regulator